MSELSHFEEESTKTPMKEPYAILGGVVLLVIVLMLLNALAPNEAVKESKKRANAIEEVEAPAAASVADDDEL